MTQSAHSRTVRFAVSLISISLIASCGAVQRRAQATEERGVHEVGGYRWRIQAESEGGNKISTQGLPPRQTATEMANILCKKHGRIAQYVKTDSTLILGNVSFTFNCVK